MTWHQLLAPKAEQPPLLVTSPYTCRSARREAPVPCARPTPLLRRLPRAPDPRQCANGCVARPHHLPGAARGPQREARHRKRQARPPRSLPRHPARHRFRSRALDGISGQAATGAADAAECSDTASGAANEPASLGFHDDNINSRYYNSGIGSDSQCDPRGQTGTVKSQKMYKWSM